METASNWRGKASMDIADILTFLAFGLAVLCFIAWRRSYRN
jgi:hypothetical protein